MKKTIFHLLLLGAASVAISGRLCAQSAPDCCEGLPITFSGLNAPGQMALSPLNGELFVPNLSDNTLHVFNSATGASVTVFGSWPGGGSFITLTTVSCDSAGNFYVSDTSQGVMEFNPAFAFVGLIVPMAARSVYADSEGSTTSLYIPAQDNNVYRYDSVSGGTYAATATFGATALSSPDGVVKVGNMVYVTDEVGKVVGFTVPGYAPATVYSCGSPIRGICAGPNGVIYVPEMNNNVLDLFSSGYWSNQSICTPPAPWGVVVNPAGNLYVGENSATVTVLQGCGAEAKPPIANCCQGQPVTFQGLEQPEGTAVNPAGNLLYVTDVSSSAPGLDIFNLSGGSPLKTITNYSAGNTFVHPSGVDVDQEGDIFAVDLFGAFVAKLDAAYHPVTFWLPGGNPRGVKVYDEGVSQAVYITSQTGGSSGSVYRYDGSGSNYSATATFGTTYGVAIGLAKVNNLVYVSFTSGVVAFDVQNNYSAAMTYSGVDGVGLNADIAGNIYVNDNGSGYLDVLTPNLVLDHKCYIQYGWGVAVDPAGNPYVAVDQAGGPVTVLRGCMVEGTATPTPSYQGSNPPAQGQCYIFPSPIKGDQASVAYDMAEPGGMTLKIFNRIGELAAQVSDHQLAGVQVTRFSVSGFAPGVYFFTVTLNYDSGRLEKPKTGKFAVIR